MIIASARVAGAFIFYSNDRACSPLAGTVMRSEGLTDKAAES